jgi:hypothetical protein
MLAETVGMAALSFAIGLGLIVIGAGVAVPERLQSAGRFDIAVGAAVLLYGVVLLQTQPSGVWVAVLLFFGYALAGVALFRRSFVLQTPDYRDRDLGTSVFLWFTGATGMIGLAGGREMFLSLFPLPSLLISGIGGVLFLIYTVRAFRGQEVYRRDVAGALLMLFSLLLFYMLFSQWFTIRYTVA